ncbi:hypothetical protein [Pseudomonas sp. NPDC089406]|uniref:hypothetical protein n=1 Tax=Pseudomonas sp. NPDC089406 TaxID=3364463 RepID=UPI00384A63E0
MKAQPQLIYPDNPARTQRIVELAHDSNQYFLNLTRVAQHTETVAQRVIQLLQEQLHLPVIDAPEKFRKLDKSDLPHTNELFTWCCKQGAKHTVKYVITTAARAVAGLMGKALPSMVRLLTVPAWLPLGALTGQLVAGAAAEAVKAAIIGAIEKPKLQAMIVEMQALRLTLNQAWRKSEVLERHTIALETSLALMQRSQLYRAVESTQQRELVKMLVDESMARLEDELQAVTAEAVAEKLDVLDHSRASFTTDDCQAG